MFVFVKDPYLFPRNMFLSLIGLAFIIEAIIELTDKKIRFILTFVILFVSIILNVSSLYSYKVISEKDARLLNQIISVDKESEKPLIIVNSKRCYTKVFTPNLSNITYFDWSLKGGLQAYGKTTDVGEVKVYNNIEEALKTAENKEDIIYFNDNGEIKRNT